MFKQGGHFDYAKISRDTVASKEHRVRKETVVTSVRHAVHKKKILKLGGMGAKPEGWGGSRNESALARELGYTAYLTRSHLGQKDGENV